MSPLPWQAPAARRQATSFSLRIHSSVLVLAVLGSWGIGCLLPSALPATFHVTGVDLLYALLFHSYSLS